MAEDREEHGRSWSTSPTRAAGSSHGQAQERVQGRDQRLRLAELDRFGRTTC